VDEYANIFIIFCYYLHFFNFVCFSFTLFLVVVATFCTDDADKSLPVKVGSIIFMLCPK
jgi:hypothetical protein